MQCNWEIKKLGECASIGAGNSAPQNPDLFKNGKYPFFRTSDVGLIKKGNINKAKDYLNDKGVEKLKLFKKGTLLFPKSGASTFLNHRVIMDVDGYVSSHLATITPLDSELDYKFMFYYLINIKAQDLVINSDYPSLKLSDIKGIEIPVPSLAIQKDIVKKLDFVFDRIEKANSIAKKNLENAKELFESSLEEIFSNPKDNWEEKKLSDVCELKYGYTEKASDREIGPKFLRITDIQNGVVDWNNVPYCLCSEDNIEKYKLILGDIVFARTGATTGKSFLINNYIKSVFASYLIRLRIFSKNLYPSFLYNFFQSRVYWNIITSGKVGSTLGGFNATKLANLIVFIPTLSEQEEIVKRLDKLSAKTKRLEEIYQQKLDNLEELKKSILEKAFNGEL